jgi:hypothetical protein
MEEYSAQSLLDMPLEILTMIATYDFKTFRAALRVPQIGIRLCNKHSQNIAKNKFIRTKMNKCGTIEHYIGGKLHRKDGPAVIYASGAVEWYYRGKLHRKDGPAIEHPDGSKLWYRHGKRHRIDGPAILLSSGTKSWYIDGICVNVMDSMYCPKSDYTEYVYTKYVVSKYTNLHTDSSHQY